jgi:exodeoxyribonuclease V alpha subunit
VYLKSAFEDERLIEATLRELASRPDIDLRRPVTATDWLSWVVKANSPLAMKAATEYAEATQEQAEVCERLFRRPLSVVTGPAGTGKTTVIEALIRAVRRSEGEGASLLVLAPTGKATDRAREVFEKASLHQIETVTVHSFLASNGWLNDNLTFKRMGGKRAAIGTLVLDEASMLDLELAAALFRAIDWQHIRRLILVGDAGQLPPIGRGRVFADLIKWVSAENAENLGCLKRNLRQLLNKVQNQGTTIVALSELFIIDDEDKSATGTHASTRPDQEELIERIHSGGAVDRDLDVIYWSEPESLAEILIRAVESRMTSGVKAEKQPYQIWREALAENPMAHQILTPHRGELHGVEALNEVCQARIAKFVIDRIGAVDGITLSDKVIQVRNRPKSNPIWAYNASKREKVKVEVFNGEMGTVQSFGFESSKLWNTVKTGYGPRLRRFAVQFTRKPGITVGYGRDVPHDKKYTRTESVEDNLELAYAVSIHKAQGSEFANTFVIIPSSAKKPVSAELVYTALTRASHHCTLLLQRDITSLLDARRRENAQTPQINSFLFSLHVAKDALTQRRSWYEAGKIHEALSGDMLRSKSEVIIANMLHERRIPFRYELPLFAGDGTMRLPDFTLTWGGKTYFWEHLGRLDLIDYAEEWQRKQTWWPPSNGAVAGSRSIPRVWLWPSRAPV